MQACVTETTSPAIEPLSTGRGAGRGSRGHGRGRGRGTARGPTRRQGGWRRRQLHSGDAFPIGSTPNVEDDLRTAVDPVGLADIREEDMG